MRKDITPSDRFSIQRQDLRRIVQTALSSGGDYCDLYFEDTSYWSLVLRDSEVSSGGYHVDYGCGVRVLSGEKTGYAYSESTDLPSLLQAARAASAICGQSSANSTGLLQQAPLTARSIPYQMIEDWREADIRVFADRLRKLDSLIRSKDQRVSAVVAMLSYSISEIMMYNSFDQLTEDSRPMGSVSVNVVFVQSGQTQVGSASRSFRMGAEFFSDSLIQEIADQAVNGIDQRFEARRPKGGVMNVVMAAGASGILLHEAMGHCFEADHCRKGQSIFADKMGSRICAPGINIVDDGTLDSFRGSIAYDDEGVPGQKTYMVEDGVLTSFLHDRISARYYGVSPTGNGRRESFRYNPIPRMRCTYMDSGKDGTLEDLIQRAGNGIFVDQFSNGQVKIGEGDFTFFVKSGYLIENGRLTMPVKDINIIGNGPQALANISAVAGDLKVDPGTWTCGKGQSVPVSCGIPSVLVEGLTVGGE